MRLHHPESPAACIQRSPEWLSYRATRIGGSDAYSVIGESTERLKALKAGLISQPDISHLPHIRRGVLLEQPALAYAQAWLGSSVLGGGVYINYEIPGVLASCDGVCEALDVVVECKSVTPRGYAELDWDNIRAGWFFQCLHNCLVTRARHALLSVTDGNEFSAFLLEDIVRDLWRDPPIVCRRASRAGMAELGVKEMYLSRLALFFDEITREFGVTY